MIHVTATDSAIGIPPNTGMVKTVLHWSSSINVLAKLPVSFPSFFTGSPENHLPEIQDFEIIIFESVKKSTIILTILNKIIPFFYALCIMFFCYFVKIILFIMQFNKNRCIFIDQTVTRWYYFIYFLYKIYIAKHTNFQNRSYQFPCAGKGAFYANSMSGRQHYRL